MTDFEPQAPSSLRNERGRPLISRALSVQARVSNWLAFGLVMSMGIALLGWYYLQMPGRSARERERAQAERVERAKSEMPLPPLGAIASPVPVPESTPGLAPGPLLAPAGAELGTASGPALLTPQMPMTLEPAAGGGGSSQPSPLQRKLSGVAFVGINPTATGASSSPTTPNPSAVPEAVPASDQLSALLTSQTVHTAYARMLPTQRLLLPKGAFIDCTLETAIDSTLPGITTCITATDTFGADGKVVLLERGTKLIGETRGQVQQAATRVFVLWTEARTPTGVVVPLDSLGADELGRSGLPGKVERHFWERFGAAVLISLLDGGVQTATQSASHGSGTVIYSPSGPQDLMGEVLKGSLNIPPTVIKNNGDRIQVLASRDVDFSHVYELEHANARQ
ncbi:MAG TPA: type IV secretion system protein VirB10 [Steroidobacteraceae bacterium]|jgi:type IV secretion system protein VirB10|nr:type IV secretion system protein VirB10 [Steroidobacteraceae bacterium]